MFGTQIQIPPCLILVRRLPLAFLLCTVDQIVASLTKHVRSLIGSHGVTSKFGGFISIRFKLSYLTRALAVPHGGIDLKRLLQGKTLSSNLLGWVE
jgi:hypothetical protein